MPGVRGNGLLSSLKRERAGLLTTLAFSRRIGIAIVYKMSTYSGVSWSLVAAEVSWHADRLPAWAALLSLSRASQVGVHQDTASLLE